MSGFDPNEPTLPPVAIAVLDPADAEAATGLALTFLLLVLLWPREFWTGDRLFAAPPPMRPHRFMLVKTLLVAAALVAAFLAGVPPAKAVRRPVRGGRGLERAVLTPDVIAAVGRWHLERAGRLAAPVQFGEQRAGGAGAEPFVARQPEPAHGWFVVAMASTMAGNLTVVGSVANLIVVQRARSGGVAIGFWEYFRVGAPLAVLTIVAGVLLL